MPRPLIFDATPLIYMIRVSLADSLNKLSVPKFLPEGVYEELMAGEIQGRPEAAVIREMVEDGKLRVARPGDAARVRRLIRLAAEGANRPLHKAEAEALMVAEELDGIVIADDHVARSTARVIHARLHGTGYLLGMMCRDGLISKQEAMMKLAEMRREGWRLSEEDYRKIIDYLRSL